MRASTCRRNLSAVGEAEVCANAASEAARRARPRGSHRRDRRFGDDRLDHRLTEALVDDFDRERVGGSYAGIGGCRRKSHCAGTRRSRSAAARMRSPGRR